MNDVDLRLRRDQVDLTHQGCSWVAPNIPNQPIIYGLGGAGRVANLGELILPEYAFPSMSTVLLGLRNLDNSDRDIGPGNIRALIKYAVGAVPNDEVLLDWGYETSISVPAGKVALTAIEYGTGSGFRNISSRIMLTAQLVPGPRFSTAAPTLTFSFDLGDNIAEFLVPPARAKRLLVGDWRGIAGTNLQVTVRALDSDNLYDLSNPADSAIRTEGVILPSSTTRIQFLSLGGTNNHLITVCFLLDG
jgi:hypothetical protein